MALLDLRSEQTPEGPERAGKVAGGSLVLRDPETIDAICLHQTACTFGVSAAAVREARGDRELAKHRRALGVRAHVTAFSTGAFVAAYPLRAYVYHGNGANARSIGLEIEGEYDGIPGGKRGDPLPLTIQAAKEACSWIVEAARAEGIKIRHVLAHRQYSATRRSDPGWAIWQQVALAHCEHELGLKPLPELVRDGGRPIPRQWDARQKNAF